MQNKDTQERKIIGNDPIDGNKIIILGKYKDLITPKTQIKRGNEKELIKEIDEILKQELGYDTFFHEGSNHVSNKRKKEKVSQN